MAIYHFKASKFLDDSDLRRKSLFLKSLVKKVRAGETKGISKKMVMAVRHLIGKLELLEKVHGK